jgi:hypothetical protein
MSLYLFPLRSVAIPKLFISYPDQSCSKFRIRIFVKYIYCLKLLYFSLIRRLLFTNLFRIRIRPNVSDPSESVTLPLRLERTPNSSVYFFVCVYQPMRAERPGGGGGDSGWICKFLGASLPTGTCTYWCLYIMVRYRLS